MRAAGGAFLWVLAAAIAAGCQPPPASDGPEPRPEPQPPETATEALRPVADRLFRELIDDGDAASLRLALARNVEWLERQPAERELEFGPRRVTVERMAAALSRFDAWWTEGGDVASRLAEEFELFVNVGDGASEVLVTGYYEPLIPGSRRRTAEYDVPVYGPPDDLFSIDLGDFRDEWQGRRVTGLLSGRRLLPYPDRREIRETARLAGREIAWARDPVDLFFVEVQGSGALAFEDGSEMRIGYAGANGREYRSIGRLLIDEGEIPRERMSMQALRSWLAAHPDEIERVLDYNTSQVFFRRLDGPPVGNLGVPVTAGRSIAVDQKLLPPGALGFLLTEIPGVGPTGDTVAVGELRRFVLSQDTGGAIRGADRVDFFWGRGEEAALRAGLMKQPGRLYLLVPRG